MKNLKKVLALVVALTMVLGTVSFAFTDVAEDSDVYTAVQTLSSLSILNGYEDGTFGPEKDITRAEFATVVCRALGYAGGGSVATQFADVPADHWASAFIGYAAGLGIVNGYGDGNFGPEDNVTYEQAIKMLVVALGFEPMAAQKGGYPTGYLVVANTYGMTEDVKAPADNAAANRGVVAHLTYNALDIPMMGQTGFGTNVEYKVLDGKNDTEYKTLLTGLDVVKLDGVVVKTPVIGGTETGSIEFEIRDNYKSEDFAISSAGEDFTLAEGVNAEQYFGYASTIYAKEVKTNNWEIIAIMPGADSETLEMDMNDIDVLSDAEVKYYQSASSTKTTNVKIDTAKLKVYFNNDLTNIGALIAKKNDALDRYDDAEVTLINNDADSAYEMIIVKNYEYDMVDEVEADRDRFTAKVATGRFTFDFEDEEVVYNIVNKDGEAITLADFAEGDVIAYILDGAAKTYGSYDWIEIINLGQNAVTGSITELGEGVYVDGVEYEVAAGTPAINVGDEGTYFLTKTGKIFGFEKDASVAANYAYVLEMAQNNTGFSTGWQIKLLTKEGKVETYDVKDEFKVGTLVGSDGSKPANKADSAANLGFLTSAATSGNEGVNITTEFKSNVEGRFVTYKLDSNGKIREIMPAINAAVSTSGLKEYNENAIAINNIPLEDDVVIFNLVSDKMDNAFATGLSSLVHESKYDGYVFMNAEGEYDAFVIIDGDGAIDWAQDIAIVDSVNTVTVNEDPALKVRYYTAGDDTLKEVTVTDETSIEGTLEAFDDANFLVQGDIIMLTVDGNGIATDLAKVADITSGKWVNTSAVTEINSDADLEVINDYIKDIKKTSNGTNIVLNSGRMLTIKGSVNAYTFYDRTNKDSIIAGDWMGAATVDVKDGQGAGKATWFFAIVENGVVSDIITHSAPTTY